MVPPLKIDPADAGERLDVVLARAYPDYSRAFLQKVVRQGSVTLRGTPIQPDYRVHGGEMFEVPDFQKPFLVSRISSLVQQRETRNEKPETTIPILFEDNDILVIDKPAGLVVHPAPSYTGPTLVDWLRDHLGPSVVKVFTDPERLGLVHRLDKDTSGVLLMAKTIRAQTSVARQFHDRRVQKTYIAFVQGVPSAKEGSISAPVGRSRKNPARMEVSPIGRPSETTFERTETFGRQAALLTVHPRTGRTHQIRVHLAAIGHPILGDVSYGAQDLWKDYGIVRPLLHAERLQLTHPTTAKPVLFKALWPKDFKDVQKRLGAAFAIMIIGMLGCLGISHADASSAEATDTVTPHHATTHSAVSHHSKSTSSVSSSAVRKLRKDVDSLMQEMKDLREQVANIQSSLDQLNASERMHNLENAIYELNSKAVRSETSAEETKTQVLELSNRLKTESQVVDELRDQVDRLQRAQAAHRVENEAPEQPMTTPASAPASSSAADVGTPPNAR